MTLYLRCGTHNWDKSFSLNACAADQFYLTTLVWTREIFPVKQIAYVAIAKTYIWMKARDVKKENQMKSKLFRGNLSTRKGEVPFLIPLYKIFICCLKEWRNSFHFTLLQEKESKLLCLQEEQYIPFNEQQKCHVTNLYTVEENKSIVLHHVLQNSPENVFLAAFVMLKLQQQWTNCQTKYRKIFQVKEENRRFIWLS